MSLLTLGAGGLITAASASFLDTFRWIHFRNTAGGFGGSWADGAGNTYCLPTDNVTSRDGLVFDYDTDAIAADAANATYSPHISGYHQLVSGGVAGQATLPLGAISYDLFIICGSPTVDHGTTGLQIRNGNMYGTLIEEITPAAKSAGVYQDADDVVHASGASVLASTAIISGVTLTGGIVGWGKPASNQGLICALGYRASV